MVSMYKPTTSHKDNYMWLAKSEDGIGLNFGSFSEDDRANNDTLRFYKSYDMVNWEFIGENNPDDC